MKFEIALERVYPHPIDEVWAGLTTSEAISEWLMETNNFVAQVGHRFEMRCLDDHGHEDVYRCEVLDLEPPTRMRWSWVLRGNEDRGHTEVEFRLEPADAGTRLTLWHRGDRDKEMLERFRLGWPDKLEQLAGLLDRSENH
ncbi:MAG: SRPBCC domain-containing protein [Woeseiaceae bacterium]|nr:SRPBCC domain-containing protein [Woeseiaceae bacterium]